MSDNSYKNPTGVLTRYLVKSGSTQMNVLLDWKMPRGTKFTLKGEEQEWTVVERYETLEAKSLNRGWNNNI